MTNGSTEKVILGTILEQWIVCAGRADLLINLNRFHVLLQLTGKFGDFKQTLVCRPEISEMIQNQKNEFRSRNMSFGRGV
jgi:hypothetical protein